jgi:site-specific recombinase XerC
MFALGIRLRVIQSRAICCPQFPGFLFPSCLLQRHTFASMAAELGFSELTIAGLLGHSARGVTQRYVHLDEALIIVADRVSQRISLLLGSPVRQSELVGSFQ